MIASLFGGVHDFFHSARGRVVLAGVGAVVVRLLDRDHLLGLEGRAAPDRRRRASSRLATLIGAIPPFLGPLVYMLFRPPEYLEDVRERELEIRAIESRLGGHELHCTVCGCAVDPEFLVCPVCTTRLRQACASCQPAARAGLAGLPVLRDAGRRRRSRSRCAARRRRQRSPHAATRSPR